MILLSGFDERLLPFGMVDRIREELGLQANAAAFGVFYAAFAGFLGVIGRVNLNAGTIGDNAHLPTAAGIGQMGARIAEDLKIVVIACLQLQRLIISADIPADGLGDTEIHRSSGNTPAFAGGDAFISCGVKEPGGQ